METPGGVNAREQATMPSELFNARGNTLVNKNLMRETLSLLLIAARNCKQYSAIDTGQTWLTEYCDSHDISDVDNG